MQLSEIFNKAVHLPSSDRPVFLDRACGVNAQLRSEVESLLQAHDHSSDFLRGPVERTTDFKPLSEGPGTQIGPYTLREQIGEGGFGLVFVAEQQHPVRRKVALKVIKPGMDTRSVVARFEAERQALAMMDHPNIAKVLDAGSTVSGRPFFVMELVKGTPITEYADENSLSTRQRLELFVQVCLAVQHAHQKGVIHRDLKPSNILVAPHDGMPVVKVIDFGVAKALGQQLTDKTIYTQFAAMIGTPLYMSPEQAEVNQLDVDTRSDIYSLGVLLYELLTGTTPFERERFKKAAFDEIRRIIKEEEPPRPSTRLTSLGDTLTAAATRRSTEPGKLAGLVRGELDWIVMRCLEKDRSRRYETANGLAKDVQRYLAGDAVEACPPTLGYRLQKAFRRNKAAVLMGGAFATVLLLATGVSLAFAMMARQSEQRALQKEHDALESAKQAALHANEREKAISYLSRLLAKFNPYQYPDGTPPIPVILAEACRSLDNKTAPTDDADKLPPIVLAKVRGVLGQMYMDIHKYQEGQQQLHTAFEEIKELKRADNLDTINALEAYANALVEGRTSKDNLKQAEEKLTEVYQARVRLQGEGHPDTLKTLSKSLQDVYFYQMDFRNAKECQQKALAAALANPELGEDHEVTAQMRLGLASMLARTPDIQDRNEGRRLCESAIQTLSRIHGPNHPATLSAKVRLQIVNDETDDPVDKAKQLDELVKQMNKTAGTAHNEMLLRAYDNLALSSLNAEKPELADEATTRLLELGSLVYGKGHPFVRRYHAFRAWYLGQSGRYDAAETEANTVFSPLFEPLKALEGGWDDFSLTVGNCVLAMCILRNAKGKLTEEDFKRAEMYLRTPINPVAAAPRRLGAPNRREKMLQSHGLRLWIELYEKWGKPQLAAPFKKQLEEMSK